MEKPAGMRINGNQLKTLENALQFNLEESGERDSLRWARPVHRLDAPTGGLVLCAKTSLSMIRLSSQFKERRVGKRYRAIVAGRIEGSGAIDSPIDGKEAITIYSADYCAPSLRMAI